MSGGGFLAQVVLTEVKDLFPIIQENDERRFSLIFRGSPNGPRVDEIADFHHSDIGTVSMFVTPVGPAVNTLDHEAVINRT